MRPVRRRAAPLIEWGIVCLSSGIGATVGFYLGFAVSMLAGIGKARGDDICKVIPSAQVLYGTDAAGWPRGTITRGYFVFAAPVIHPRLPLPKYEFISENETGRSPDGQYWRCQREMQRFLAPQRSR